jgi:hypothetical protein
MIPSRVFFLCLIALIALVPQAKFVCAAEGPSQQSSISAGTSFSIVFPELGKMHEGLPAACSLSVPKTFVPGRPTPLLVWCGGGQGTHDPAAAHDLVDFDRFIVVALPYPGGRLPRLAAKDGGDIDAHWRFQSVMLKRIRDLFPEIEGAPRVIAGTSSGGHLIAYGLDRSWPGFADYFTHFVLHEGGAQPLTHRFPGARGKRLLVVYGEESDSLTWRTWFNWQVERSGAVADIIGLPGSGHGLDDAARAAIRRWTDALPPTLTP